MKSFLLLISIFSSGLCYADAWEDVVRLYSKYQIDQQQLTELNNMHISVWSSLNSSQQLLASKGTIITSLYASTQDAERLNKHAQRLIRCMALGEHGVTNHKNSLLQYGLMECAHKSE